MFRWTEWFLVFQWTGRLGVSNEFVVCGVLIS